MQCRFGQHVATYDPITLTYCSEDQFCSAQRAQSGWLPGTGSEVRLSKVSIKSVTCDLIPWLWSGSQHPQAGRLSTLCLEAVEALIRPHAPSYATGHKHD